MPTRFQTALIRKRTGNKYPPYPIKRSASEGSLKPD